MRNFLSTTAMAVLATTLFSGAAAAAAENPFRCKPGEKYVMNVMVSGVEYWFPVYGSKIPARTIMTSASPPSSAAWRRNGPT